MTRFYTRTGDDGTTSLLGEGRVPKDHPRMEAVGALDEATAALGVARASVRSAGVAEVLLSVQRDLYGLMAEVAATPENAVRFRSINAARVDWLEKETDRFSSQVDLPREFIVPGDSPAGATLSLARVIVRRAERRIVHLLHLGEVDNLLLLAYLNRLSSLCFVLELVENRAAGMEKPTLAKERD